MNLAWNFPLTLSESVSNFLCSHCSWEEVVGPSDQTVPGRCLSVWAAQAVGLCQHYKCFFWWRSAPRECHIKCTVRLLAQVKIYFQIERKKMLFERVHLAAGLNGTISKVWGQCLHAFLQKSQRMTGIQPKTSVKKKCLWWTLTVYHDCTILEKNQQVVAFVCVQFDKSEFVFTDFCLL